MTSTLTPNQEIPLATSITTPIFTRYQLYIPEPPLQQEKTLIWKSILLIPFTISEITYAFSGPFHDLNANMAKISELFPSNTIQNL